MISSCVRPRCERADGDPRSPLMPNVYWRSTAASCFTTRAPGGCALTLTPTKLAQCCLLSFPQIATSAYSSQPENNCFLIQLRDLHLSVSFSICCVVSLFTLPLSVTSRRFSKQQRRRPACNQLVDSLSLKQQTLFNLHINHSVCVVILLNVQ